MCIPCLAFLEGCIVTSFDGLAVMALFGGVERGTCTDTAQTQQESENTGPIKQGIYTEPGTDTIEIYATTAQHIKYTDRAQAYKRDPHQQGPDTAGTCTDKAQT